MTATPTMTPKTSVTGVMLACVGAATLAMLLQMAKLPAIGGWRGAAVAPAPITMPVQTRGTHAIEASVATDAGTISTIRGRN